MLRASLSLLLPVSLVLTGCGDDDRGGTDAGPAMEDGGGGMIGLDAGEITAVDVLGSHAGLMVSWTLETVEASQTVCSAFGASNVEVVFTNESGATFNLMQEVPSDFLSARCSGGGYTDLDPRFAVGEFELFLQAVDDEGNVVGRSEIFTFDTSSATAGSIVDAGVVDIAATGEFNPLGENGSVSLSWTINGMEPTAELCASAQNAEGMSWTDTRLIIASRFDTAQQVVLSTTPCADGTYDSRPEAVLKSGSWAGNVQLLSGETVLGETGFVTVSVPVEGHVVILDMPLNIDLM